jgi:hypothetical protein
VATITCPLNDFFSGGGRPPHRFELRAHSRPCVVLCSCPAAAPRWWLLNPHPSCLSADLFLSPESINDPQYKIAYLPTCSAQWPFPLVGCSSLGGQPHSSSRRSCARIGSIWCGIQAGESRFSARMWIASRTRSLEFASGRRGMPSRIARMYFYEAVGTCFLL